MAEKSADPVVFAKGVHRHELDGVEVTLVVPDDVRLSQIAPALARVARGGEGGGQSAA